ncbi:PAS domain-containing protein [Solibacillus sp. A46]|uniref:histidine kinase n=1 Tax=Solibacillus faecavium TaxID=2762221 RepID=A0ABR8XUK2_9BACL|nr:ATP-binding protein [Solibacillus faecavium]MBD8035615.1 PAS domain-containing protein [Solibacillus faecavium]
MEGKSPMMVEALFNESSEQIIIFNRLGNLEFINKKAEETLKSVHLLSNFWSNTDKNNSEWERFIRTVIENSTSSTTLFLVNKYHQKMPIKIWGYYLQQKQLIFTRIQINPSNVISFEEKNDMIVFQNLINGMAQGVILTMLDGKILSVNEMALHLLDRKPAQIENRSYDYLFEDCHYESSVIVQYYKKISNREMASLFVKKETADGKTVYLNFISKVDENLGLLVTTIIDQTEEMMLLKKIEHQQSLSFIGQNIASIAHEIRNPMTSIQGFIQMIKSSLNEEQNPYFQIVESELKRMDDLLVDLLSIAKPKKQVFKSLDMKVLVDEAIQLMQPTALTTDAMIVFEFDEEIEYTMMGDYSRLKQMVINILKNAIESVEYNNYIVVKLLYSKDSSIKLSIKDSGKGMNSLDLENALNPFYTTKEYGSGLGLLLVQSVIKEHNAILHIESEVGVGTNFIVEFNPQSNREFMNPIHAYKIGESRISANIK